MNATYDSTRQVLTKFVGDSIDWLKLIAWLGMLAMSAGSWYVFFKILA